jgi:hypothetical protein
MWNEILSWLNCSHIRLERNVSVTRPMMVAGIELASSMAISVKTTPITQPSAYQPVMSVSRVESASAPRMRSSVLPFFSEDNCSPISSSSSMKGLRERSLRFLSMAMVRRKASGSRM